MPDNCEEEKSVMSKKTSKDGKKSSPDTLPIKTLESPQTAEEIMSQGEEASRVLSSDIYNLAHRSVIQNLQDEWMTTAPHETQKREGLWHRVQALSAVAGEMAVMVANAKALSSEELAKESKMQLDYDENSGF